MKKGDLRARFGRWSGGSFFLFLLLTLLLVGAVFYFLVWPADQKRREELEAALTAVEAELNLAERKLEAQTEVSKQADAFQEALGYADGFLLHEAEMTRLTGLISDLGRQAGARAIKIAPRPPVRDGEFWEELPFTLSFEGTFAQTVDFFYDLSLMDQIVVFDKMTLNRPGLIGNEVLLAVECLGRAYRSLEPAVDLAPPLGVAP